MHKHRDEFSVKEKWRKEEIEAILRAKQEWKKKKNSQKYIFRILIFVLLKFSERKILHLFTFLIECVRLQIILSSSILRSSLIFGYCFEFSLFSIFATVFVLCWFHNFLNCFDLFGYSKLTNEFWVVISLICFFFLRWRLNNSLHKDFGFMFCIIELKSTFRTFGMKIKNMYVNVTFVILFHHLYSGNQDSKLIGTFSEISDVWKWANVQIVSYHFWLI